MLCQKNGALFEIFALCPKSLRFLRLTQNLCALFKIFALLALCPKSLHFAGFSQNFALCSEISHFLENLACLAPSQKTLRFPQNLCAFSFFLSRTLRTQCLKHVKVGGNAKIHNETK
jgi:hypothetical protein